MRSIAAGGVAAAIFAGGAAAQGLDVSESVSGATLRFAAELDDTLAVRLEGRVLTIRTAGPVAPPDLEATADAASFVSDARIGEDGRSLILDLAGDYSIDALRMGSAIEVDIFADPTVGVGQVVVGPSTPSPAPSTPPAVAPAAETAPPAPGPATQAQQPEPEPQPEPQPAAARPAVAAAPPPVTPRASIPDFVGEGDAVGLRLGEHPDRTRIVFDWPRPVSYEVDAQGPRATISFARPGRLDLRKLKTQSAKRLIRMQPTPGRQRSLVRIGPEVSWFRGGRRCRWRTAWGTV